MKKRTIKKLLGIMVVLFVIAGGAAGCGRSTNNNTGTTTESGTGNTNSVQSGVSSSDGESAAVSAGEGIDTLNVTFGDAGETFVLHLEDNDTAKAIAGYVGTSNWRLPIYERDDDVDYSVMEYYDIPNRYEIPFVSETVTEAKAGDVYYSDPNRIVLFYQDAEISEEYAKIGTFDATNEFISAVEDNPVLEGWGNKIIQITR